MVTGDGFIKKTVDTLLKHGGFLRVVAVGSHPEQTTGIQTISPSLPPSSVASSDCNPLFMSERYRYKPLYATGPRDIVIR